MNSFNTLRLGLTVLVFSLTIPGFSYAQDSDGATSVIEEVLVTARKRTESVLEIPESIAVFSDDEISRRDITTLDDIGNSIANLNLSKRADGFPNVSIRGVGSFGNTQGVGFYLDDVQMFSDASVRHGDLERIEVLKGPQGTLYGGSNIGGAIKYVTKRPDSEGVSGRIKARAGEQSIMDFEGSLNVPLGDSGWATRLFGFIYRDDGYLDNPNTPRLNGLTNADIDEDEGKIEEQGIRASIAGPLTDRLSLFASVRWNDLDGPNNAWVREIDEDLEYPDVVNNTFNSIHTKETIAGTLELTMELDGADIISLTSLTDTDTYRYTDVDLSHEYIFDNLNEHDMETFTQELRVTSTHDGPLQWAAGAFFSKYEFLWEATQYWFDARVDAAGNISGGLGCALGMPTCSGVWTGEILTLAQEESNLALPARASDHDKTSLGAFVNLTYSWEDWEVNGGLRVDRWKNTTVDTLTDVSSKVKDTEILPRFSVTRTVNENHIVYFTLAEGYEPGGFNSAAVGDQLPAYAAEQAISYELGWKGRAFDGRMNLTLAGFYIDYKARQIEFQADNGEGQLVEGIFNLGGSEQYGIEAEASFQVTDELRLSAAFGWVDAEWNEGVTVQGVNVGGTTPPVVQDINWHLGADYERPIGENGLTFIASVQINHSGEYEGLQVWDTVTRPDYTLVNAQVGVVADQWEVLVSAKNLFNEDHYVDFQRFPNLYLLDGGENILIGTRGQPRLITGSITYRF